MLSQSKYHITAEVMEDENKIILASQRDPERFGPLYEKYHEPVFRFVYQRISDKDTAFDITSQVFLKALMNIGKYQFKGLPFASWLYRIAYNEVINACNKSKVERSVNLKSSNLHYMLQDMQEEDKEIYFQKLTTALTELQEPDLQLIEMRYFESRSFKEIGEILDITENNAKVRLYRVLDKLKKYFNQH